MHSIKLARAFPSSPCIWGKMWFEILFNPDLGGISGVELLEGEFCGADHSPPERTEDWGETQNTTLGMSR
jgi:hypothetical protein